MIDPKKPSDRFFMFLPGFLSWAMILMPLWLGYLYPKAATFILTFIAIYWLYMAVTHAYGLLKGYKTFQEAIKTKWIKKVEKLDFEKLPNKKTLPDSYEGLKHILLIPTYKETIEILEPTFKGIMNQTVGRDKIIVIVGTEEAGEEIVTKALDEIKEKYGDKLPRIMQFIHPKGLPHEIVGVASPNRTWAAKHGIEQLKKEGIKVKNCIFTTFDSDATLHPEFLACVTYNYLTDEKRYNRFYETAVHLFSNNIWEVPLLARIEAVNLTLGLLSSWTTQSRLSETFACYSVALDTLIAADYWDVRFIDDTLFYWRAFEVRKGDFSAKYFHIPIYSDATGGANYVLAHKNLFKQLVRWGWGSVSTAIAFKMFFTKKLENLTTDQKLVWLYLKIERHLLVRTSVFLITFGFTILTFVNTNFRLQAATYGLPKIISIFLTAGVFMFIPLTYVKQKLYPVPKTFPKWRKYTSLLEAPFVMINMLTYGLIPWLYAETMMMFGYLPKVTHYTEKTREPKKHKVEVPA